MEVESVAEYRARLARILGFEAAVEGAVAAVLDATVIRGRMKAHWLRRDLHVLGMTAAELECLPYWPTRFASMIQALGWLYVIERQTLLAGLIRRQLEHRFAELHAATSYLSAYGDTPGARFRSLCMTIDEYAAREPRHPTLIVAAASEAFRCQRQWYGATTERETTVEPVHASMLGRADANRL
jgi:heme oxygenase